MCGELMGGDLCKINVTGVVFNQNRFSGLFWIASLTNRFMQAYPFKIEWDAMYTDPALPLLVDIGSGSSFFLVSLFFFFVASNIYIYLTQVSLLLISLLFFLLNVYLPSSFHLYDDSFYCIKPIRLTILCHSWSWI